MELLEFDITVDSNDLVIAISGRAPVVGPVMIRMRDFDIKGTIQAWTIPHERLLLIAFKTQPEILIKMSVKAATRTLDFKGLLCAPIERTLRESVRELVQGRRRIMVPLEVDPDAVIGRAAVDGEVDLRVLACSGLPGATVDSRYQVVVKNAVLEVERRSRIKTSASGNPTWKTQHFKFRTGDATGIFIVRVQDLTTKKVLGLAVLYVAALPDGCTAFWSADKDGRPIAKRWKYGSAPFRLTVPLEDKKTFKVKPSGDITLEASMLRWMHKQEVAPKSTTRFITPGPRSVVLRVLEAHNIGGPGDLGPVQNLYVQVVYNGICKETQAVSGNNHPVWDRTFVFEENQCIHTRDVRLKVLSKGRVEKDFGFTCINLDSIYEGRAMEAWVELGGTPHGRLHVVAEIVPGREDSKEVQDSAAMDWVPDIPYIKVEVIGAKGLKAADLDGKSDPYCIVRLGKASTQTEVVSKSLNPVWNHKAILPLLSKGTLLKVNCWDYDFLRKDDELGSATLDISTVLLTEGQEYSVDLKLHGNGDEAPGKLGEVTLKLTRIGDHKDIPDGMDDGSMGEEDVNWYLNSMAEQPPFQADAPRM